MNHGKIQLERQVISYAGGRLFRVVFFQLWTLEHFPEATWAPDSFVIWAVVPFHEEHGFYILTSMPGARRQVPCVTAQTRTSWPEQNNCLSILKLAHVQRLCILKQPGHRWVALWMPMCYQQNKTRWHDVPLFLPISVHSYFFLSKRT